MAMNYACPMHPEVTSDKPGRFSKCGWDGYSKEKLIIAAEHKTIAIIECKILQN